MSDEFGSLPVFVTVIEQGGFSAAARKLRISKSAVSKRIYNLEQALGVRLLNRTTRTLSLTEAGERYFEHAQKALAAAIKAENAVAELQGEPQGNLKISCPMSFGRLHLAPMFPVFLKKYPKIQLDVFMDDRRVDIVDQGIDLAIRSASGVLPSSTLVARKIAPLRHVLCASPEYVNQHGEPKNPWELNQLNAILFSNSSDGNIWTFQGEKGAITVAVSGNYRVNNSEAILESLRQGMGIARLPSFVASPHIKSGRLLELLGSFPMPSHTFYAVYPAREYLPAKVRVFLDFAVDYFGNGHPYWDEK